MADQKLTALTPITIPNADTLFYVADDIATIPVSRSIAYDDLLASITGSFFNSRVVVAGDSLADRTLSGATDLTMECDTSTGSGGSFTMYMPPIANAVVGQEFVVLILDPNQVTINGNGATINGLSTIAVSGSSYKSVRLQKSSRGVWVTI